MTDLALGLALGVSFGIAASSTLPLESEGFIPRSLLVIIDFAIDARYTVGSVCDSVWRLLIMNMGNHD